MSVGARLDSHTESIPEIAMAPPHTDPSDGTGLSVSLTGAIAVDYVTVILIFRQGRLDGPCVYIWLGKDRSSTCGCDRYNVAGIRSSRCAWFGSHELVRFSLCT